MEEQSASEEAVREFGAPAMVDEPTQKEQAVDSSLVEGDVAVENPVMDTPLAREEPAAEHPTLGCEWPPDSQEEDRVEVHTPKDDPNDW